MKPVALVTGASGKLGRVIADWLALQGYSLVLHGFRKRPGLIAAGDQVIMADFASHEGLEPLCRRLAAGDISLLVNSASSFERGEFATMTHDQLATAFAINLHAPVALMQAMARGLAQSGLGQGLVIHLLDAKIERAHSAWAAYTLSRKALAAAAGMAAVEYAGLMRINAVAPRLIADASAGNDSETVAGLLDCFGRIVHSPRLNAACLFLDGRARSLAALAGV